MLELPWIEEAKSVLGLHETRDNAALKTWLISDGKTLGDPDALPWCGDFVETCIKRTLPNEILTGTLKENPYWARNWLLLGKKVKPCYGCVIIFERGKGGHVGFLVGEDTTDFYVLGGNQGDTVSVSRISKKRMLGTRWPSSHPMETKKLPVLTPGTIPRTQNEI